MQLRFNVPQGPTGKIIVDIVLTAPTREPFTHNSDFLSSLDTRFKSPSFPSADYLSSDFNRPGKYYLAVAMNKEELNITPFMERFERIAARLRKYHKKTLPLLQRKNENKWTNLSGKPGYHSRREAEIRSIHSKKKRLEKELDILLVMMYLYIGRKTGASYFGWDGVSGITTRGKKGCLAVAITNMPKKKVLHDLFDEWAQDCLSAYKMCLPVSPFTSSTCGACGRRMKDPDTAYDEHICLNPDCNTYKKRRCRHSNAAWVGAQMLERVVAQISILVSTIDHMEFYPSL